MTKTRLRQRQRSGLVQWPALGLSAHHSHWSEASLLFISQQNISARRGEGGGPTDTEHREAARSGGTGLTSHRMEWCHWCWWMLMHWNQTASESLKSSVSASSPVHRNNFFSCSCHKITNHLPDPVCENSFRLNMIQFDSRYDNNKERLDYGTI